MFSIRGSRLLGTGSGRFQISGSRDCCVRTCRSSIRREPSIQNATACSTYETSDTSSSIVVKT
eukprot:2984829-Rhodomonas_salina.6